MFSELKNITHPQLVKIFCEFVKRASREELLALLDLIKNPPPLPPPNSIADPFPLKKTWEHDAAAPGYQEAPEGSLLYAARALYLSMVVRHFYNPEYYVSLINTIGRKTLEGARFTRKTRGRPTNHNPWGLCVTYVFLWLLSFSVKTPGIRNRFYLLVQKENIQEPEDEGLKEKKRIEFFARARNEGYLRAVGADDMTSPPGISSQLGLHVAAICHSPYGALGETISLIMVAMEQQSFGSLAVYIHSFAFIHAIGLFIEYSEYYITISVYDPNEREGHARVVLSRRETSSARNSKIQALLHAHSNITYDVLDNEEVSLRAMTLVSLNPDRANNRNLELDCVPCVPGNLSNFLPHEDEERTSLKPSSHYRESLEIEQEQFDDWWRAFLRDILIDTILETDNPVHINRLRARGLTLYDERTKIYFDNVLPWAINRHRHNSLHELLAFPDVRPNELFEKKTLLSLAITLGCFVCVCELLSHPRIHLDLNVLAFAEQKARETGNYKIYRIVEAEFKRKTALSSLPWNDPDW